MAHRASSEGLTFLPVFVLIPGFKVQTGLEEFEEFIKGRREGLEGSKKVPATTLKKCKVTSDYVEFVTLMSENKTVF